MTETGKFFDGVSYTEADQADAQNRFRREGVLGEVTGLLSVGAPGGMFVSVAAGEAMVQGFQYKNTASLNLAIANNTSGSTRVDSIVLRLLRTSNSIHAFVVQGTPGGGAPTLTQVVGGDWDYLLATVTIPTGTTAAITAAMIADARTRSYALSSQDTVNGELTAETAKGVYKTLVVEPSSKVLQWAEYAQPRENHLENPTMRFNQRNTTTLVGPSTAVFADRWHSNTSDNKYSVSWVASTMPTDQVGGSVQSALEVVSNGAAITSTGYAGVYQSVEGFTWSKLFNQPLVLSWWDWSSVAATYVIALGNGGTTLVHPYSVPGGVWTYNWCAIPPVNIGAWNFTTGTGIFVSFMTACGSSLQTATADTWITGNFSAHTSMTNNLTTNGHAHYIGAPKLEIGHLPSRFVIPDFVLDQQHCFRQLWVPPQGPSVDSYFGFQYGSIQIDVHFEFPITMRAIPSLTHTIVGNQFILENKRLSANSAYTFSSFNQWEPGIKHFIGRLISSTAIGGNAGDAYNVYLNGSAMGVTFSAEL